MLNTEADYFFEEGKTKYGKYSPYFPSENHRENLFVYKYGLGRGNFAVFNNFFKKSGVVS